MALPPGFLEELRDRVSLAQIVGRKVTWDMRKSNQSRGDWWAPCPFHQEKTASFHVDERKGFYYCFGCHAKGDSIAFLRELDGMSFMEAVEEMARVCGLEMPAPDPKAAARAKTRATLSDVMEHAVRHFRQHLSGAAGREARAYLQRRGLSRETVEAFEIGFAPPGWEALRTALTSTGVEVEQILACGLARPSDKGRAPYDTFRNRIMFPIRDTRGRTIAFGGRAMDPSDTAKYLNSPDTELFDKGRTLYNQGAARTACGKGAPLIVAEGYMDVIALAQAGFAGAVAPLGTAVTEDQLRMLWKIHDEPLVALDGDTAGLRAGHRVMDLALPLMEAGQSLRFALLPAGQDPDDVLRAGGPEAMQAVLDAAVPMVDLMWRRATEGRVLDSPERRAALEKDLRAAVARINDPSIRSHYGHALRERRADLFGLNAPAARVSQGQGARWNGSGAGPGRARARYLRAGVSMPAIPSPQARAVARAGVATSPDHLREAVILATLVAQPALIEDFADVLEDTVFTGPGHDRIASALLMCDVLATKDEAVRALDAQLGPQALETLLAPRHVQLSPGLRRAGDVEAARACLAGEFAKLDATRGAAREIAEAIEDMTRADARGGGYRGAEGDGAFDPHDPGATAAWVGMGLSEAGAAYQPEGAPDWVPDWVEDGPGAEMDDASGHRMPGHERENHAADGPDHDRLRGYATHDERDAASRPMDSRDGAEDPADENGADENGADGMVPDPMTWRLAEAARARSEAGRVQDSARTEYDVADNGARIDRAERDAFSQLLRSMGHAGADGATKDAADGRADRTEGENTAPIKRLPDVGGGT